MTDNIQLKQIKEERTYTHTNCSLSSVAASPVLGETRLLATVPNKPLSPKPPPPGPMLRSAMPTLHSSRRVSRRAPVG